MITLNNSKQTIAGNGNQQNIVNIHEMILPENSSAKMTHSFIYDLLEMVNESSITQKNTYQFAMPIPMKKKIKYNNAPRWWNIFINNSESSARVKEVMNDFPDSETIVGKLRYIFLNEVKDFNDDMEPIALNNGDEVLDAIMKKLMNIIQEDSRYTANCFHIEQTEQFCVALIACGVESCNVLVKPE